MAMGHIGGRLGGLEAYLLRTRIAPLNQIVFVLKIVGSNSLTLSSFFSHNRGIICLVAVNFPSKGVNAALIEHRYSETKYM